jgi:hypothetical protein
MKSFRLIKKYFLKITNEDIISKYWNSNNFDGKLKNKTYWYGRDDIKNFILNGNKKYGYYDVLYELNEYGFRINTSANKNNSSDVISCFGCSNTFGVGLPYHETWPSVLNTLLGDDFWVVKNYGVCGASNDTIARLICDYINNNKPKIICCYFPEIFRLEFFNSNLDLKNFFQLRIDNNCSVNDYNAYKTLSTEENCLFNFIKNFKLIQNLCLSNNIKFYWNTWSENILGLGKENIIKLLDYNSFTGSLYDDSDIYKHIPDNYDWHIDSARDGAHFGTFVNEKLADSFYKKIIKDFK